MMLDILPWLFAMLVLLAASAFFSASEAAYFSLRGPQRRRLALGRPAQRLAAALLEKPDRLLTSVLFANLFINIVYFAVVSLVEFEIRSNPNAPAWLSIGFPVGSLLVLILMGEMLPKSLGVILSPRLASIFSLPLAGTVRLFNPVIPALQAFSVLSRRLLWPRFQEETYMDIEDLERAIELSSSDANLIEQERSALQGIVSLADLRVDECMRPRSQLTVLRPPVHLEHLRQHAIPGGYLLITEFNSDEISSALHLTGVWQLPARHLEREAEPVVYCPWCVSVAEGLQQLLAKDREVVAVINELGETIGALTLEDILDIAFSSRPGRSERLLDREPIREVAPGRWQVEGMTNVRRLADHFELPLPATHSVTVAGVLQEQLQRLPQVHDTCQWGPLRMEVVRTDSTGQIVVQVELVQVPEDRP